MKRVSMFLLGVALIFIGWTLITGGILTWEVWLTGFAGSAMCGISLAPVWRNDL